jgi:AcrR family transcriptional regulator
MALDADTILAATEDVLRRYGPSKATVVDVARALGVSHAAVYRHFPSKAELRQAVVRRWLGRAYEGLAAVTADTPPERLRAWLAELFAAKRAMLADPELFATYRVLAAEDGGAGDHLAALVGQVRDIIVDGVADGHFTATDPETTAQAVFEATAYFHHPAHAAEWTRAGIEAHFDAVCALVIDGIRARPG